MNISKLWKLGILFLVPLIVFFIPPPAGLSLIAWRLFALYLTAILGLILKPYSEPVILLAVLAASAVTLSLTSTESGLTANSVLNGYQSGTTWLVFAAFTLSAAFVSTGLGRRIAYYLISLFGGTVLRLGYVTAILDLFISPATPSNTARAGGIVFPIVNSVAGALGSDPEKSPRKAGHYLLMNTYMVTKTTSYMFLTAMAPNALALSLMEPILHISLSWKQWALAAAVPGIICLILTPLISYLLYKPELHKVDNKKIATEGLQALGPMSLKEKILLVLFFLALLGWVLSEKLHINATTVALCVMSAILIFGVVKWEDILKSKGGWNTLIWYGGIIGLSSILTKAKFFEWLAHELNTNFTFSDNTAIALFSILFISVAIRYLFASGGAYVAAMMPVFATVGVVAQVNPMLLALGLLFSNSYGGMVTHYGGAAGPIIFGAGYNDIKSWWIVGGILAFGSLLIHCTIGIAWWQSLIALGALG